MGSMQGSFGRSWMRAPQQGQAAPVQQQTPAQNPWGNMFSQYMQRPMFQAASMQRQPFMNYLPLLLSRGMFSPQQGGMPAQGTTPAPAIPAISNLPPIASQAPPPTYQATPPLQQQPAAAPPAAPAMLTPPWVAAGYGPGEWENYNNAIRLGRLPGAQIVNPNDPVFANFMQLNRLFGGRRGGGLFETATEGNEDGAPGTGESGLGSSAGESGGISI